MDSQNNRLSSGHLKWIVIGILGITFMLVFKDDLSNLLKNTDTITVGPEGVSIVTKTVQTPLGETIVSGPPTIETAGITARSLPDYQSPRGFLINWPQDGSWSLHPELASALSVEIMIGYNHSWGDFVPNVNVTIEPDNNMSIRQWMENSNPLFIQLGMSVTDVHIDDESRSAVRVIKGNFFGLDANAIQRIILSKGRAYIATAVRPTSLNADPKLWRDLNYIINSLRV